MKKYKLINTTTKEEHLCDKVIIDGFNYYVSDEVETRSGKIAYINNNVYKGELRVVTTVFGNSNLEDCKKVIATNNPTIDIPKVVNKVEKLAKEQWGNVHRTGILGFIDGYNKSQETHPFSEEDMIEFVEWCQKPCLEDLRQPNVVYISSGNFYWYKHKKYTPKELLQLWKEQQPKVLFYE